MPEYRFSAWDAAGNDIHDTVEAPNPKSAMRQLLEEGWVRVILVDVDGGGARVDPNERVAKAVLTVGQVASVLGVLSSIVGTAVVVGMVEHDWQKWLGVVGGLIGFCLCVAMYVVFTRTKEWPSVARASEVWQLRWELGDLRRRLDAELAEAEPVAAPDPAT